jgi:uncharacterized protein involved in exopolysaccharide biosynthesis
MTELSAGRRPAEAEGEISLIGLASVVLRWRRLILALAVAGGVIGLVKGLASTRVYKSSATFVPQGSEGPSSGLLAAADQLGIRVPSSSGAGWGPTMYVEVLRSSAILEPVAFDTVVVAEERNRRVALLDLLEIEGETPALKADRGVKAVSGLVKSEEVKQLGGVRVSVTTRWPSVSFQLAEKLVHGVNQFNTETRQSQAAAERQFVEVQAGEAERALRVAEDRLQEFLERNRVFVSPDLVLQRDRLQREVGLRQELYTTLMQSREEARIREVRNTPVITVLEHPRMPVLGEPRGSVQKAMLGTFIGGALGLLIAFIAQGVSGAKREPNEEAQEFFRLVEEATPRFIGRRRR